MRHALRSIFIAVLLAMAGTAVAGQFEDGETAYQRKDNATAVQLWRPLADQSNALALLKLGFMYFSGQGVLQDDVLAHMWFNLAAAQGYEGAIKQRDLVARFITPDQIAEAQRLARE